jgi:hypothetical protein
VQAVMIDSRAYSMPPNINGNQIQPLVDAEVANVTRDVIFYKIESTLGNLVGYFSLKKNGSVGTKYQQQIRPPFLVDISMINSLIDNFVLANDWQKDYL